MEQAKEGILLDANDQPILTGERADSRRQSRAAYGSWDEFQQTIRSRVAVRKIAVPGWGLLPLTLFIAALIPVIFVLFIAGVAFVVIFKTFVSPLLRLLLPRR